MRPGRTPVTGAERVSVGAVRIELAALTKTRYVDVLGGEEEDVDADTQLDALLGGRAVERVLGNEEGLLLVRAVELVVLAMLERTGTNCG